MASKGRERGFKIQYVSSDTFKVSDTIKKPNSTIRMLYLLFNKHERTVIFKREKHNKEDKRYTAITTYVYIN